MLVNKVREALETKGRAIGTFIQMRNPEACQVAGAAGFDFVIIDMEHGSIGFDAMVDMVRAAESQGASPVVRVPDGSPWIIKKVLDAGAAGILVPQIRTAEDAARAVQAAHYETKGIRGSCPCIRASRHSIVDWQEYRAWSDKNVMVWPIIETVDAVANIEAILDTGVDAIHPGPFDLSMNMGLNGDTDHPDVVQALDSMARAASARGVDIVPVLFGTHPDDITRSAESWQRRGARMFIALTDRWCLAAGYRGAVDTLRRL